MARTKCNKCNIIYLQKKNKLNGVENGSHEIFILRMNENNE